MVCKMNLNADYFVFYLEFTDELVVLGAAEPINKFFAGRGPFVLLGEL